MESIIVQQDIDIHDNKMEPKDLQEEFDHTVAEIKDLQDQIRVLDHKQEQMGISLSCHMAKKRGFDMEKNDLINKKKEVKVQLQDTEAKLKNFQAKGEKRTSKKMLKSRDRLIELEIQLQEIKNNISEVEANTIKIAPELEALRVKYMSTREQVDIKYRKVVELRCNRNEIAFTMNNEIQGFSPEKDILGLDV